MKKSVSVDSQERRRFWEQHVENWQRSGLSQTGYCRNHGLSQKSFIYWKKKLLSANAPISLVELPHPSLIPVYPVSTPLRLLIGGRYRIDIERGFDAETLHQVLGVLER